MHPLPAPGGAAVLLGEKQQESLENKPAAPPPPPPPPPLSTRRPGSLLKKSGCGRKVRPSPAPLHARYLQYQQQQNNSNILHNNSSTKTAQGGLSAGGRLKSEPVAARNRGEAAPAVHHHHPKPCSRKEVLKSKMGRSEKITVPHSQHIHSIHKCEQPSNINKQRSKHNLHLVKATSVRRHENSHQQNAAFPDVQLKDKNPLNNVNNLQNTELRKKCELISEALSTTEAVNYAGAKFSDPPSPSVLPKPPSHWVGKVVRHSDQSRELMTVHLKTLLKVQ
uniref:Proline rich nuclear receptor coactivator 1 n=2 Tax=Latimeria chalumnae TaxID=7897 RepID=H3A2J9_LATCH